MAHLGLSATDPKQVYEELETRLTDLVNEWLGEANPTLPTVLTAHASVQGAVYGGERTVMLGGDLVLSGSLVKDPRLDYVALGHIHKPQNLNEGAHPPVIYPGSIERVDFGEAGDDKFFVIAHVEHGDTSVEWRQLVGIRPFIDRFLLLDSQENVTERLIATLPEAGELGGAIVRLTLEYPRDWESLIDESALREHTAAAFEFHLVKRPQMETRIRLPEDQTVGSLTPLELLDIYWRASHVDGEEAESLLKLAESILGDIHQTNN
jgi:exonuclease SbcD